MYTCIYLNLETGRSLAEFAPPHIKRTLAMQKVMRTVLQAVKPSPRCSALDDDKKAMVIVLVGQGASRREAAELVKCHHTTIGRTAARDAAFGAKLAQVESAAHLEAGDMIRRAGSDPKYWRAAAWMLERRNPEDYGRRDPTTFTGDQVTSLLASFCNEAQKLVPQEKTAELEKLFDDVLDEIAAKSGPAKRDDEPKKAETEGSNATQEKPSQNGHHTTNGAAESPIASNGRAHAELHENGQLPSEENRPHPSPLPKGEGTSGPRTNDCALLAKREEYESFEPDEAASPEEDDEDLESIDDADAPPELLRRRQELDAELAAHIGGYATTPPSPAARDILRDFNRRFVHHPRHWVAAEKAGDALRKVFDVNNLHQQSTRCTTAPDTQGRCTNGVLHAGDEPSRIRDEG
jgi:hypothetical protein